MDVKKKTKGYYHLKMLRGSGDVIEEVSCEKMIEGSS